MSSFSKPLSWECTRLSRSNWRQSSRKMNRANCLPSPVRIFESASFQRPPQRPGIERIPWSARKARIRLTCRVRSFFNCVRSRERRLASSSATEGSRTGRQTDLSPSRYAFSVNTIASTSTRSVFTRRPRRETRKLDGSRIVVSMSRSIRKRASQKPS